MDAENNVNFGQLHDPWKEEHIQQVHKHLLYPLITMNYAFSKEQIKTA